MRATVRAVDVCARYGGEELAVIMPSTDAASAVVVAERLRKALEASPLEKVGVVTASFGVSSFPGAASSSEELIDQADRALYTARQTGRNRVVSFEESSDVVTRY
jgi:two-component system cell cycle response regulator